MDAKHEPTNVANGTLGALAATWTGFCTWVSSLNLATVNQQIAVLAGIGGLVVVGITIKRGFSGMQKDRDEKRERDERHERERRADHDRIVKPVPPQTPGGELEE